VKTIDRRQFLQAAALVSLAGCRRRDANVSATPTQGFSPDVDIALRATTRAVPILPGAATACWVFEGELLRGPPEALQQGDPGSYLGPTIRLRTGQKLRVRLTSDLPQPTVVHWHGLHVPAAMDGHPRDAISAGQTLVYEFKVRNRAGTYWYHAHPDRLTGPQVYRGLAGLLLVSDAEEAALGLPRGERDLALVLQDRSFDRDNALVYATGGMAAMTGFHGDRILCNGRPQASIAVPAQAHRLRILNASNARIYRLAWSDGAPLVLIGTDGGLLTRAATRPSVWLAPAERVEVWRDLAPLAGTKVELVSLPLGERDGAYPLVELAVGAEPGATTTPPDRLAAEHALGLGDAVNGERPREVALLMSHMSFTLGGRSFAMDEVAADERIALGTAQAWRFSNLGGGGGGGMGMMGMGGMGGMGMMGMPMPHPIHIHGGQFRVALRVGATRDDVFDQGWKDTVLVMPGEAVTVVMRFDDFVGRFLYHCHNLEHEDRGMMRNYLVS
jgi:FtsP/CotA-like multicopper oxidase with cupredoxin domain